MHKHVGDADAVLIVVVAAVESGYGAIGSLRLHELGMCNAVKEANDARPAARDAKLTVRWMDASGGGHRHPEVISSAAVREEPRRNEAVGLNRGEEEVRDVVPIERHRFEVVLGGTRR